MTRSTGSELLIIAILFIGQSCPEFFSVFSVASVVNHSSRSNPLTSQRGATMPERSSTAVWEGDIQTGNGTMTIGSGAWTGPYSFKSRFEDGKGTNPGRADRRRPRRLLLDGPLRRTHRAGSPPKKIETKAKVDLRKEEAGFRIAKIHLTTTASVPGLDKREVPGDRRDGQEELPRLEGARRRRNHASTPNWRDTSDGQQSHARTACVQPRQPPRSVVVAAQAASDA